LYKYFNINIKINNNMTEIEKTIYSNNNTLLLELINELQQIINSSKDNAIIKRISDIIIKMNFIINENKKSTELIINHINNLKIK